MQISITGRHVDLSDSLRAHVEKRLEGLQRYFDGVIRAHVVFCVEKSRHVAEITIQANNVTLHAEDETADLYASIDGAADKIEKQLKRHKDRLRSHRTRSNRRSENLNLAIEILDSEDMAALSPTPRVIRSKRLAVKPMGIDEATLQMDLFNKDFIVFLNARSGRLNVLYRRSDGTYGLIEPYVEEETET